MRAWLGRLLPFHTPDARHLAMLFAIVYLAQGTWYLPDQPITTVLKERGLSASQVAFFFFIARFSWNVKPLYGLLSDLVPLFGRRRQSYVWLSSALAAGAGLTLAVSPDHSYAGRLLLFSVMGLGLAFTDVLIDALMVESGKPLGLTGAFQSIQWAALMLAQVLGGEIGGHLAEGRNLHATFWVASSFPLVSLVMAIFFVREPTRPNAAAEARESVRAARAALSDRTVWLVAGFIFFWAFSPSSGTALQYYQTDTLRFSQVYIGRLLAVSAVGGVIGALMYAPLSRRLPLRPLINLAIGLGTLSMLAYLFYRDATSALVIDGTMGAVAMVAMLAFLDLAAKACPPRVEATFFALLMSVYNVGTGLAQWTGGKLYDTLGWSALVWIGALMTAAVWLLVPLVRIDAIEAAARRAPDPPLPTSH